MIQAVPDPPIDGPGQTPGVRERNRLARHRNYLRAALSIVYTDGLEALTMQRLAAEVSASVGSVYTYFPSKGALVAEVQREAIERLATSALVLAGDVDRATLDDRSAAASLAPIVAFGRFWLAASHTYPEEMQLLVLLLADVTQSVPDEEAGRVVPAALRLLGLAESRIGAATEAGSLDPADPASRTIALAASLTGCVQLEHVSQWDPELLDPVRTGHVVLDGLLRGWGADPGALRAAHQIVDGLEATGPLARPVPGGDR